MRSSEPRVPICCSDWSACHAGCSAFTLATLASGGQLGGALAPMFAGLLGQYSLRAVFVANCIAYLIARTRWRTGLGAEAAQALVTHGFEALGLNRLIALVHPDNIASQALAKRLGSSLRGPGQLPEPFRDEPIEIWAQTREQWLARRQGVSP